MTRWGNGAAARKTETIKHYRDAHGSEYRLTFSGDAVYYQRPNEPIIKIDSDYLNQDWVFRNGQWTVLPIRPSEYHEYLWALLALDFLPHWENVVRSSYTQRQRKLWSHHGATTVYGDVGNRAYSVVVDLCLHFRRILGLPELWTISSLGTEKKGDILEGVMGLEYLHPSTGWEAYADAADVLSAWVYAKWTSEYPNVNDSNTVFPLFSLHLDDGINWNWVDTKIEMERQKQHRAIRIAITTSFVKMMPWSELTNILCNFLQG